MAQTVEQALAATTLYTDDQEYVIVRLPSAAITAAASVIAEVGEPFCAMIVDKDEVSLIIPSDAWKDFSGRLLGHAVAESTYRLITLDIQLDMDLIGFMARVSSTLADANVPILPIAAYTRDHILVPSDKFEVALATLTKLKSSL